MNKGKYYLNSRLLSDSILIKQIDIAEINQYKINIDKLSEYYLNLSKKDSIKKSDKENKILEFNNIQSYNIQK